METEQKTGRPSPLTPAVTRKVEELVVSEYLLAGPISLASHAHDKASLSLLLHGGYCIEMPSGALEVRAPMVAFFPARRPRRVTFASGPVLFLWVELPDALTARLGAVEENVCGFVPASSGRPDWLAHRLLADVRARDASSGLLLQGRILEILGYLARSNSPADSPPQPSWLPAVLGALGRHTSRIPLRDLARLARLYPAQLSRAFKQHMGCSVGEYARQSRVARARTLLVASPLSLVEIAAECGFADQAHFSREFKRLAGSSPLRFRREGSLR